MKEKKDALLPPVSSSWGDPSMTLQLMSILYESDWWCSRGIFSLSFSLFYFPSSSFLPRFAFFSLPLLLLLDSSCLSFRFLPLFLMLFYYILFVLVLLLLDSLASSLCFSLVSFSSSLPFIYAVQSETKMETERRAKSIKTAFLPHDWRFSLFLSLSRSVFPWQPLPVMYSRNGGDTSCIPRSLVLLLPFDILPVNVEETFHRNPFYLLSFPILCLYPFLCSSLLFPLPSFPSWSNSFVYFPVETTQASFYCCHKILKLRRTHSVPVSYFSWKLYSALMTLFPKTVVPVAYDWREVRIIFLSREKVYWMKRHWLQS